MFHFMKSEFRTEHMFEGVLSTARYLRIFNSVCVFVCLMVDTARSIFLIVLIWRWRKQHLYLYAVLKVRFKWLDTKTCCICLCSFLECCDYVSFWCFQCNYTKRMSAIIHWKFMWVVWCLWCRAGWFNYIKTFSKIKATNSQTNGGGGLWCVWININSTNTVNTVDTVALNGIHSHSYTLNPLIVSPDAFDLFSFR